MQGPKKGLSAGRHRIYVDLGHALRESEVGSYFQQLCTFGRILDVYIPRHNSGRNKGFGFVTFERQEDLLAVLQNTEHIINGNLVKINRAGPRPEYKTSKREQEDGHIASSSSGGAYPAGSAVHGKGPRLYVGGISDDVTEDHICAHFTRWGSVVDIYFPGKKGQKRVNYCFVTFDNWRAAQRACNQSERNINGSPVQSISVAEDRAVDSTGSAVGQGLPHLLGAPTYGQPSRHWIQNIQNLSLLNSLQQSGATGVEIDPLQSHLQFHGAQYPLGGTKQGLQPALVVPNIDEELLLRTLQYGNVQQQQQPPLQRAQRAHADFQAKLLRQPGSYNLPPGAVSDLASSIQGLGFQSNRIPDGGHTTSQLGLLQSAPTLHGNFPLGRSLDYMPDGSEASLLAVTGYPGQSQEQLGPYTRGLVVQDPQQQLPQPDPYGRPE